MTRARGSMRLVLLLGVLLAATFCAFPLGTWYAKHPWRWHGTTVASSWGRHLGFELPGVQIKHEVLDTGMFPRPEQDVVVANDRKQTLSSLSQLRGMVRIGNPAEALVYVRFGTELRNWAEAEITIDKGSRKQTGVGGRVTKAMFDWMGCTRPTVRGTPSGFVVTRWIYVQHSQHPFKRLQKVQEAVGTDGSYTRTALVDRDPPKLDGLELVIPYAR